MPASLAAWLLIATALPLGLAAQQDTGALRGRPLTEVLLELAADGLQIVFTSSLVTPGMRVEAEPRADEPRAILDELLAPHGLAAREGPEGSLVVVAFEPDPPAALEGVVISEPEGVALAGAAVRIAGRELEAISDGEGRFALPDPGVEPIAVEVRAPGHLPVRIEGVEPSRSPVELRLERAPVIVEKMVVVPSRLTLLREEPSSPLGLTRDEILALPHLGDDFFRALTLLPGATANDVSARFHVRGGRTDENLILLDGQELYDAYHLQDYDGAASFIAPQTIGKADLVTGGFPAEYGDRMSGVLDMSTVVGSGEPRFRVGAGILGAHAGGSGGFANDRGGWIAEVRRGSIDFVGRLLSDEDPSYWDLLGKIDYRFGDRHTVRGNLLATGDRLDFEELVDGEVKRLATEYESGYLWLTVQTILSRRLFFDTAASRTRIERERRGIELEDDLSFAIRDDRDLEVVGLRQSWSFDAGPRHTISAGWQARRFEVDYDYAGTRDFDNPLAVIRHDFGRQATDFRGRFEADHQSLYAADRLRLGGGLSIELGARYDRHNLTDERLVSPRLNIAWTPSSTSVVRLAWGRFTQSQRPYELQVEDGETAFQDVERSEHRVVGYERIFGRGRSDGGEVALRVELYQRAVKNPRPQYVNLFEPINNFPEVEPDRVLLGPDRALAEGLEVLVRGTRGPRLRWWVAYSLASTEDRLPDGWAPRTFDETHRLNLDLDYRFGDRWRLNFAWRYHTGWPTTPLRLEPTVDEEGATLFTPVLGPVNGDRLPDYHRLDLRASRRWRTKRVTVHLFVDVQNVYDRANIAGFDYEIDSEAGTIEPNAEAWVGFLPSAGVSIEF